MLHKPCPFCGSTKVDEQSYFSNPDYTVVYCESCKAQGPKATDRNNWEEAWKLWDERSS